MIVYAYRVLGVDDKRSLFRPTIERYVLTGETTASFTLRERGFDRRYMKSAHFIFRTREEVDAFLKERRERALKYAEELKTAAKTAVPRETDIDPDPHVPPPGGIKL